MVEGGFELKAGYLVKFVLNGLWVIEHPFSLFLLGADVIFRGRKIPS